jgi:phage-related protein
MSNLTLFTISIMSLGIIGDAFGKLFEVIWGVVEWIGSLIRDLFQGLIDLIIGFFEIIYALIDGLLYLLYMIGVLAVKLFLVMFEVAKLLWSLVVGFGKTLASLSYTPQASSDSGYSEIIGKVFDSAGFLQINVVAYILLFALWYTTAIASMKLLSSIRVGGD